MRAFVWVMITVLTFELLNLKSCYASLPVLSLIATSSYSCVSCYWGLLLRQEILSFAFVRQSRDPAIQADGPVLSEAVAARIFSFSVTPNTPPVGETVQHIFWYKDPLQDAFEESSSSPYYKKGVLSSQLWWGIWGLCKGRVHLHIQPVPAQAWELCTILEWQTSPWKETHTWASCFNFPMQAFLEQGNK